MRCRPALRLSVYGRGLKGLSCCGSCHAAGSQGVGEKEAVEGTGVALGGGAGSRGDGELAGELETFDARDGEGAEGELVANSPLRDEGDAEAGFDGAEEAFGGVELHDGAEIFLCEAGGGEGLLDDAAGAGTELTHEDGGVAEVGGGDLLVGPLVARGNDEDHAVLHEGFDVEIFTQTGTFDEGELDAVVGDGFEHGIGVAADGGDGDAGVLAEEGGDEVWQEVLADGLGCTEGEGAGVGAGGAGDGFEGLIGEGFKLVSEGQEGGSSGGEGDAAAGAVEEGKAVLVFQGFDLLGDGGLGEEELFGGAGEVEVSGDGAEDLEAEVFHGGLVRWWFYCRRWSGDGGVRGRGKGKSRGGRL